VILLRRITDENTKEHLCQNKFYGALANYPTPRNDVVQAIFSSACSAMVKQPLLLPKDEPGAVMGMFDIHARQFFPKELLTMTMRYEYAAQLAGEIPESFLSIEPWTKIKQR